MHIIIIVYSSVPVLNFMLPACTPRTAEVTHTTYILCSFALRWLIKSLQDSVPFLRSSKAVVQEFQEP